MDKIVGPGNAYVAAAKKLAFGTVDIDMIAGPSEVLVIADHTANPTQVAADLLERAEHDRLASAVLLTDSMAQAQAVSCEMERMARARCRAGRSSVSVAGYGCAIVFEDLEEACKMADMVAPEHLEVMTAAPLSCCHICIMQARSSSAGMRPSRWETMAGPCPSRRPQVQRGFLAAFDGHVPEENQHHRIHARRAARATRRILLRSRRASTWTRTRTRSRCALRRKHKMKC